MPPLDVVGRASGRLQHSRIRIYSDHGSGGRHPFGGKACRHAGAAGDIEHALAAGKASVFEEHLKYLKANGYTVIPLRALVDYYLKKFDIDYLKIDQSFVRDITTDPTNQAIAESIIAMAHKLGLKVIAEGIETAGQRDLLATAGCDYGQGYLFSQAVPADEFEQLLAPAQPRQPGLRRLH